MTDKAIEPSEIIVEQDYVRTKPTRVNPWIRFFARYVDYALFFCVLLVFKSVYHAHLPHGPFGRFIPFEYFVWIPIEAILLFSWGTTPGKWFLKTYLRFGRKHKPDFKTALRRSFSVWFRGLGMGIPVVNAICLLVAYNRLKLLQTTSWDREDAIQVHHGQLPRWRLVVASIFIVGGFFLYFSVGKALP
ncbi:MAG: RDD family protein [Verrucomicrobia bacterium]|nr:RDD family protein [Verrucomicrobiota bacterium]